MKKIILYQFAIVCMIVCSISCKGQNTSAEVDTTPTLEKATVVSYKNVDVTEFNKAIENGKEIILLDVRTPEEIADGKVPEAIEYNYYDEDFADKINAMDKDKSYYIYCRSGGRSAKTAQMMIKNGFSEVYNLKGGYTAWSKK